MNIQLLAVQPRNSKSALIDGRLEPGQLDTFLLVTAPDGIPMASNDDWISTEGEWSSNATIENLLFAFPGDYLIEARSYMDEGVGEYTLEVTANRYGIDTSLFQEYSGHYRIYGFDYSITLEDEILYLSVDSGSTILALENSGLLPVGEDMFVINFELSSIPHLNLLFTRDEDGAVSGLRMDPCVLGRITGRCWGHRVKD